MKPSSESIRQIVGNRDPAKVPATEIIDIWASQETDAQKQERLNGLRQTFHDQMADNLLKHMLTVEGRKEETQRRRQQDTQRPRPGDTIGPDEL